MAATATVPLEEAEGHAAGGGCAALAWCWLLLEEVGGGGGAGTAGGPTPLVEEDGAGVFLYLLASTY